MFFGLQRHSGYFIIHPNCPLCFQLFVAQVIPHQWHHVWYAYFQSGHPVQPFLVHDSFEVQYPCVYMSSDICYDDIMHVVTSFNGIPCYVPGVLVFHNGYYNSARSSIFSARYWLGFGHSKFYMGITSSIKVDIWHPPVSCVMNHNSRSVFFTPDFVYSIHRKGVYCHIAYPLPYAICYFYLPCWSIFDVNCCLEVAVDTFNKACVVVLLCEVHAVLYPVRLYQKVLSHTGTRTCPFCWF